jgi:nucleotide-binding universal stress UspA family protein
MVRHVLIAIDASSHARLALKVARSHYPDAQRHLITVVDSRALPLEEGVPISTAEAERRALASLGNLAWDTETCAAVTGEPAEALLRATRASGADVLVIGTHGRRGLGRWMLGSVAEEVMRRASVPVLVVREASVPDDRRPGSRPEAEPWEVAP